MTPNAHSVFQTEIDMAATPAGRGNPLRALGFLGRVLEGAGILAMTLFLAILALTSAARADTMLADVSATSGPAIALALLVVFAVMLAMVRQTWRQTAKGIQQAPRRSHRIG